MKNSFFRGIYAGALISIGCIIFLSVENRYLASALFSFGLLTILFCGWDLYTGKVGYARSRADFLRLPVMLLGNVAGCSLIALLARQALSPDIVQKAIGLSDKKLGNPYLQMFCLAIFCGFMMYAAVECFRRSEKKPVLVMLPIMIFLLAGFEHSVADTFYFFFAGKFTCHVFLSLLVMVLGNGVGSLLLSTHASFLQK